MIGRYTMHKVVSAVMIAVAVAVVALPAPEQAGTPAATASHTTSVPAWKCC
jgi:hypothetical protein